MTRLLNANKTKTNFELTEKICVLVSAEVEAPKLCGGTLPKEYISESNLVYIIFHSEPSGDTCRGFSAHYSMEEGKIRSYILYLSSFTIIFFPILQITINVCPRYSRNLYKLLFNTLLSFSI